MSRNQTASNAPALTAPAREDFPYWFKRRVRCGRRWRAVLANSRLEVSYFLNGRHRQCMGGVRHMRISGSRHGPLHLSLRSVDSNWRARCPRRRPGERGRCAHRLDIGSMTLVWPDLLPHLARTKHGLTLQRAQGIDRGGPTR